MEKKKRIPVIICARGGSKRLPRKNVLPFCGQPLIAWAIVQAKYCKYIDDVWVTTDDDEIADIAEQWGARIIRRPDWEDADKISAVVPTKHAVKEIMKIYDFDIYSCSLPTDIVWHPWQYDGLFERYYEIQKKGDNPAVYSTVAYCRPRELNIFKIFRGDCVAPILGTKSYDYLTMGTAINIVDRKKVMELWAKRDETRELDVTDGWDKTGAHFNNLFHYYIVNWYQGTSIDDQETWELNEIFMKKYILQGRGIEIYREYAEERDGGTE